MKPSWFGLLHFCHFLTENEVLLATPATEGSEEHGDVWAVQTLLLAPPLLVPRQLGKLPVVAKHQSPADSFPTSLEE